VAQQENHSSASSDVSENTFCKIGRLSIMSKRVASPSKEISCQYDFPWVILIRTDRISKE